MLRHSDSRWTILLPGRQSSLLWKAGETVALIRHTINLKITSALSIKTVRSNAAMSSIIKFLNRSGPMKTALRDCRHRGHRQVDQQSMGLTQYRHLGTPAWRIPRLNMTSEVVFFRGLRALARQEQYELSRRHIRRRKNLIAASIGLVAGGCAAVAALWLL